MRISDTVGAAAVSGLALMAVLAFSAPVKDVKLVDARQSGCGVHELCADDPPPEAGDQPTAEQQIIDGYKTKQLNCTPYLSPNPESVTWDPPGFVPYVGGTGMIRDANPQLGGQYRADYVDGRWHSEYPYC
jgi:hypothetical protein